MKTGSFFTTLMIVLLVAFLPGARAEDRPLARQGVLDLRGWDFKARGLVKLDGEWEFIWNRLVPPRENDPGAGPRDWPGYIRVPRIWNGQTTAGQKLGGKGVGTYGLTIRLPQQNSIYALFIQEAGSAYDLYLDGRLLARVGFPGETKETSRPAYKPMLVKFHPRGEETRLTILVSNFHQNMGGLWEPLLLGLEEQLADHRMIKTGLDFFLFGAILIMGLYHLGLFLLRKTEPAALYFFRLLPADEPQGPGHRGEAPPGTGPGPALVRSVEAGVPDLLPGRRGLGRVPPPPLPGRVQKNRPGPDPGREPVFLGRGDPVPGHGLHPPGAPEPGPDPGHPALLPGGPGSGRQAQETRGRNPPAGFPNLSGLHGQRPAVRRSNDQDPVPVPLRHGRARPGPGPCADPEVRLGLQPGGAAAPRPGTEQQGPERQPQEIPEPGRASAGRGF